MDDRELTVHERITRELKERVSKLLERLREADTKGDKEEADRVVDELVRLAETYWPWMIEKGKINPVQEAIWAIRLAKSPGLWDKVMEFFFGEPPFRREEREQAEKKKKYYEEMKETMKWFHDQFKEIVLPLSDKYHELYDLLARARTKEGKSFREGEAGEVLKEVNKRAIAAGVLKSALEGSRELNPAAIMNIHSDSVEILRDTSRLKVLINRIYSLLGLGNPALDSCIPIIDEITMHTQKFVEMLGRMRRVGLSSISIHPEEVGETGER